MKPTVGRIVHYYDLDEYETEGLPVAAWVTPHAAIITHVFSDLCVNLHVFGHSDAPGHRDLTSVCLSEVPVTGEWCWPPRED